MCATMLTLSERLTSSRKNQTYAPPIWDRRDLAWREAHGVGPTAAIGGSGTAFLRRNGWWPVQQQGEQQCQACS